MLCSTPHEAVEIERGAQRDYIELALKEKQTSPASRVFNVHPLVPSHEVDLDKTLGGRGGRARRRRAVCDIVATKKARCV